MSRGRRRMNDGGGGGGVITWSETKHMMPANLSASCVRRGAGAQGL